MTELTRAVEITAAVKDALVASADSLRGDAIEFSILLHYAEHDPSKVDPRIPKLLAVLATDPALEIFNGRMVVWPSSAMRVEYRNLAGWLIRRGTEIGPSDAVTELNSYLGVTEIPCLLTVALSGIRIEEPCDLGNGVTLLPWDALPDSGLKRQVHRHAFEGFGMHWPTAAIIREETHAKRHLTHEEYQRSGPHLAPLDDSGLLDAALCVGMIGPSGPYAIAIFLAAPAWVPVTTGGVAMPFTEGWPSQTDWPKAHCSDARTLHQAFLKLNKPRKQLLRLAMQRLNRAMRRHLSVDAAIDLGIALEALFLSDMDEERGEPTFRLRIRAARYLGTTKESRDTIFDLVGDLYRARSSAVHTGHVSDQLRGRPINEALKEGYSLAASAIRRMILDGPPDWTQIMLG